MPRPTKPSGGRNFSRTCILRGHNASERWAVLKEGAKHVRVARIAPDGLTSDESLKVPADDVLDIQPAVGSPSGPQGSFEAVVGERGAITIPSEMRRRHRLQAGSHILLEERGDEIVIIPAEVVRRSSKPGENLAGLLAQVTPENLHGEVSTGPAVGEETW